MASVAGRWFARLFAGEPGIDPYTRAVSDVYQDLFGEGSFIGKGIYDVDAFEQAVGGRFPENRILSHDLLEGCYARAGLVSDVVLLEELPVALQPPTSAGVTAGSAATGRSRRGCCPRVPGASGRPARNPISALSRWKILDNLRRSLVPGALVLLLLLGWTILNPAWFWTCVVVGILFFSPLLTSLVEIAAKPPDLPLRCTSGRPPRRAPGGWPRARSAWRSCSYDAFISLDAALKTWWRMLVTRRRLLEWQTSSEARRSASTRLAEFFRMMWIAPTVALAVTVYLSLERPTALVPAGPLLRPGSPRRSLRGG